MSAQRLVQMLTEFPNDCLQEYEEFASTDDFEQRDVLAILLAAVRECRTELLILASTLEQELLTVAGTKTWIVDGLGEVQIRRSMKRTDWDSHGLIKKLTAIASDERELDEATGEYEREGDAVARVLEECARPSWRVTALRKYGLHVDEWCHEEPDKYTIQLPAK